MLRRRRKQGSGPGDVYDGLRSMALTEASSKVSGSPLHPDVLGVVIDIPRGPDAATLVALADGTTSLYTSTGGGTIGGGGHPSVVDAGVALLVKVQGSLDMFPFDDRVDLPPPAMVQLTVLTPMGRRRASVPSAAFWGQEPSSVVDLIAAAQAVLSALREVSPPTRARGAGRGR